MPSNVLPRLVYTLDILSTEQVRDVRQNSISERLLNTTVQVKYKIALLGVTTHDQQVAVFISFLQAGMAIPVCIETAGVLCSFFLCQHNGTPQAHVLFYFALLTTPYFVIVLFQFFRLFLLRHRFSDYITTVV